MARTARSVLGLIGGVAKRNDGRLNDAVHWQRLNALNRTAFTQETGSRCLRVPRSARTRQLSWRTAIKSGAAIGMPGRRRGIAGYRGARKPDIHRACRQGCREDPEDRTEQEVTRQARGMDPGPCRNDFDAARNQTGATGTRYYEKDLVHVADYRLNEHFDPLWHHRT